MAASLMRDHRIVQAVMSKRLISASVGKGGNSLLRRFTEIGAILMTLAAFSSGSIALPRSSSRCSNLRSIY
jgi:hypothetical protein